MQKNPLFPHKFAPMATRNNNKVLKYTINSIVSYLIGYNSSIVYSVFLNNFLFKNLNKWHFYSKVMVTMATVSLKKSETSIFILSDPKLLKNL